MPYFVEVGENLRVFQVLCRLLSTFSCHDAYHILSHRANWIWWTFQAQTERGSAVGVAFRPLHPSESQPSPIGNVLVVDQGPRTENHFIYQLGCALGGARWHLPTDSLPSQVDLERGRAVCWVALLFKCKFTSWTTRHYFYYLEIYLVRDIHLVSAYIFERKCRSYVSNHQVWGTSSFKNIISRLQGDAWLLIASMCMYLREEVLILAKTRGSSPICDLSFERRCAQYLAEVFQMYDRYKVRTQ